MATAQKDLVSTDPSQDEPGAQTRATFVTILFARLQVGRSGTSAEPSIVDRRVDDEDHVCEEQSLRVMQS